MKKTIQTKRNNPASSNYRVLYAKTGRKRRLNASTTAAVDPHVELESDVPNIGIGRALLVILVLHIMAIAAIYVHSTFFGNEGDNTANQGQQPPSSQPVAAVAAASTDVPEPVATPAPPVPTPAAAPVHTDPESERYIVVTGDTYMRIAKARNVDEQALRALNSNRPLRAGVVLDLPAELSSRPVDPTPRAEPPSVAVIDGDRNPAKKPPFKAVDRADELDVSNAPKAIVVKPNRPAPVVATGVTDSGQRYTIKSGDTLWRISNRFKVSRDAILKLNGIKDPNKLYAGREIKIPAK
ncbi:MAG: LysM peptidoglycan-binding domain-containing protein [Akkermansiaceae bacterium]|nr:LysM peptidoglycan-binding domain-containing protein [Akkermansiaceae bacterium]